MKSEKRSIDRKNLACSRGLERHGSETKGKEALVQGERECRSKLVNGSSSKRKKESQWELYTSALRRKRPRSLEIKSIVALYAQA